MNEDVLFINLVKSIILELEPRFDFFKKHQNNLWMKLKLKNAYIAKIMKNLSFYPK